MTTQLKQNLRARAVGHRHRNKIAHAVGKQRIPPEHLHVRRLVREVRLKGKHNGHHPVRIPKGNQTAGSRLIAAERDHAVKKRGVFQGDGERFPAGLRDAGIKCGGIAKLRAACRQLFPK